MTMQKTAIWILALGILPVSAGALGRMQSSDGSPARPTNAAPLVPVRSQRGWQLPNRPALRRRSGIHGETGCPKGACHPLHDELRREQTLSNGTGRAPAVDRAAPRRTGTRDLQSRRSIRRSNVRSPSTFLPDTCPIRQLRSSSCRTNVVRPGDAPAAADGTPRRIRPSCR